MTPNPKTSKTLKPHWSACAAATKQIDGHHVFRARLLNGGMYGDSWNYRQSSEKDPVKLLYLQFTGYRLSWWL